MDTGFRSTPRLIGAVVVVLALIAALVAFSYRTTAQLDANFKAAGINPSSLHAYHPAGKAQAG